MLAKPRAPNTRPQIQRKGAPSIQRRLSPAKIAVTDRMVIASADEYATAMRQLMELQMATTEYEGGGALQEAAYLDARGAVQYKLDLAGMKVADVEPLVGSKDRLAQFMTGSARISIADARLLSRFLNIPLKVFAPAIAKRGKPRVR